MRNDFQNEKHFENSPSAAGIKIRQLRLYSYLLE